MVLLYNVSSLLHLSILFLCLWQYVIPKKAYIKVCQFLSKNLTNVTMNGLVVLDSCQEFCKVSYTVCSVCNYLSLSCTCWSLTLRAVSRDEVLTYLRVTPGFNTLPSSERELVNTNDLFGLCKRADDFPWTSASQLPLVKGRGPDIEAVPVQAPFGALSSALIVPQCLCSSPLTTTCIFSCLLMQYTLGLSASCWRAVAWVGCFDFQSRYVV